MKNQDLMWEWAEKATVAIDGKEYIDFTSGIFAANVGHANEAIDKAILEHWTPIHTYTYNHPLKQEYLDKLCEFTGYESAVMFSSGTEATEAAWKVCRIARQQEGIVGLPDAMHGKTLGAEIAAGKIADHRYCKTPEQNACIMIEPYIAHRAQFWDQNKIQKVIGFQQELKLPLILDEIQGGFGRTGKLFAYEHYPEIKPDLVCVGKGLGSGFPMSAILGPKDMLEDSAIAPALTSTHGGNPLACAVGIATIEEFERLDLIHRAEALGHTFVEPWIENLDIEAYGKGLLAGIIFENRAIADKVVDKCFEKGLLVVRTDRETVKIGPPLVIDSTDLDKGLEILKDAIRGVLG